MPAPSLGHKMDQGNEVTAETGCSSAICRRVCESPARRVGGRCPRHKDYWMLLSLLVRKDKEDFAGRWCLRCGLQHLHPCTAANPAFVLLRYHMAGIFTLETFVELMAEM